MGGVRAKNVVRLSPSRLWSGELMELDGLKPRGLLD